MHTYTVCNYHYNIFKKLKLTISCFADTVRWNNATILPINVIFHRLAGD